MRPNKSVSNIKPATTPKFKASTAGKNCTFAIHDSQHCNVPVKSRKSRVIKTKNTVASVTLIFFSISINVFVSLCKIKDKQCNNPYHNYLFS